MAWFRKRAPLLTSTVKKNIESVAQLEQEFDRQRSGIDRISDAISAFAGSVQFLFAHVILFTGWIVFNCGWGLGWWAFDPYPFQFLNLAVALEAIFLSTFIMMSQNRQNSLAEQWAHINLQVSMLAEQETTQMLKMLRAITDHLGLHKIADEKELKEMVATTSVEVLAEELEKAREAKEEKQAANGPPEGEKRIPV